MSLFKSRQLSTVVEWKESESENVIFHKFPDSELKLGSKLILRPGQNALFLYDGALAGVFPKEGSFDIESEIIPFISNIAGFKFGFDPGHRAEVVFVNTKELTSLWGTVQPIYLQDARFPGGIPIRANGIFVVKAEKYGTMMEKLAGAQNDFTVENVKTRILASLNTLVVKHTAAAGDFMYLQTHLAEISDAVKEDLNKELSDIGLMVCDFKISQVSYPKTVSDMIEKVASQGMIGGNMGVYQQTAMADAMSNAMEGGPTTAGTFASMAAGMSMANSMAQNMMNNMQTGNSTPNSSVNTSGNAPKFCPQCGKPVTPGAKFCQECGNKL